MVALLDSGDTAAWACGRGAWTLVPSGRLPMQAGQFDLRKVDRHPLASVATPVLGLRCSWCPESAPMPRILGLLPPAAKAAASNL
jgi:hypothetical protein